jgi:hypothetical protein
VRVFVPAFATPVSRPPYQPARFQPSFVTPCAQSMNVAGASRRSAAPGSQFVGVAGYGDDSSRHVAHLEPKDRACLRPLLTWGLRPPAVCLSPAHSSQRFRTRSVSLSAHHLGRLRYIAETRTVKVTAQWRVTHANQ